MAITADQVSEVIAGIYEAVGSADRFTPILRRVRTLVNGSSGMLFTPLCGPAEGGFGFVDHFDTELFSRYRASYRTVAPWEKEAERKSLICTGATFTDEALIAERELQRDAFYHEAHVPMDVGRVCCTVVSAHKDTSLPRTYLSVYRGVGSRPFTEEESHVISLLSPHVLQALRLAHRLEFAEASLGSAHDALHELECGVVLIDAGKRIVFMNRRAERLCIRASGLQAIRRAGGEWVLEARLRRDDAALQRALDTALRVFDSGSSSAPSLRPAPVAIHRAQGEDFLLATAVPLPPRMWYPERAVAQAVVLVEDPAEKSPAGQRLFSALFRFTPAECRVALALLAGEQPKAIAERLAVSENTVRTQIKSIYVKTGTRGIAALIALLTRLADTRAAAA